MTELEAKLAVYGYSFLAKDYTLEYNDCVLEVQGPRYVGIKSCVSSDDRRILEKDLRALASGIERRILVGENFETFSLAYVGTVNAGSRKERYVEVRKIEFAEPIDLSLINVYSLGLDVDAITPERPAEAEVDRYSAAVISAVLSGKSSIVYVPLSRLKDPIFHFAILKNTPSYAFKVVTLDTNASEDSKALIRVQVGLTREEIESIYAKTLLRALYPDILKDLTDEYLYRILPRREDLLEITDASALIYIAKYESIEEAVRLLDKRLARALGKISKVAEFEDVRTIAKLLIAKGLEKEAIEAVGSEGQKLISELAEAASEIIKLRNEKAFETALRIAKAIASVEEEIELALALLYEIYEKYPERKRELGNVLIKLVPKIPFERLSDSGLTTFFYLAAVLEIPDRVLEERSDEIVNRVLKLYDEYIEAEKRPFVIHKQVFPTLFFLFFNVVPKPKKIREKEKIRELLRELLEALRYNRFEIKKAFDGYKRGSDIDQLAYLIAYIKSKETEKAIEQIRNIILKQLRNTLKEIAGDEYRFYFPVPREERIKELVPELEEEYRELSKNIEHLREEIREYLEEEQRERESPSEEESDEVV